jgi:hypothetical protein
MKLIYLSSSYADVTSLGEKTYIKWWFRHALRGSKVSIMSYFCEIESSSRDEYGTYLPVQCNLVKRSVFNDDGTILTIPVEQQFGSPSGCEEWDMISGDEFNITLGSV